MQKIAVFTFALSIPFVLYGQIIADHRVVEEFDEIPAFYISEVKKMMIWLYGESHAEGIRTGLTLLESTNPTYQVNISTGESYTDQYLRCNNGGYGGEDIWFTWHAYPEGSRPSTSMTIKNLITEYNSHGHPMHVFGMGWCWDIEYGDPSTGTDPATGNHWYGVSYNGPDGFLVPWGLNDDDYAATGNRVNMDDYMASMEEYIAYCKLQGYPTKMVFSTGPVDTYYGEVGYQRYLKHEYIRNYVKADASRILFDYADILCYDDGSETPNVTTWNGHTYPIITATNVGSGTIGHIGTAGAIRLAKAQWWLMARIAGWSGGTSSVRDTGADANLSFKIEKSRDGITIILKDSLLPTLINITNFAGSVIIREKIDNNTITIQTSHLPPGIYFTTVSNSRITETRKVIIP